MIIKNIMESIRDKIFVKRKKLLEPTNSYQITDYETSQNNFSRRINIINIQYQNSMINSYLYKKQIQEQAGGVQTKDLSFTGGNKIYNTSGVEKIYSNGYWKYK